MLPLFKRKYKNESLILPSYFQNSKEVSVLSGKKAAYFIFRYNEKIFVKGFEKYSLGFGKIFAKKNSDYVFVSGYGMGAPAMVMAAECLRCLGIKEFIILGIAGGLKEVEIGDIVICGGAYNDVGVSYHYLKDELVLPDKAITEKLKSKLDSFKTGYTWTTDAPYRETAEEVEYFSSKNALTVEMEAGGLFSFCKYYGLKAGAVFVISDILYEKNYKYEYKEAVKNSFENLNKNLF